MSHRVFYSSQDHLIDQQSQAEDLFLAKFESDAYSIETPCVIYNPYLINPLCALILFKTDEPVQPTVTIQGKRNHVENLSHTFAENTVHILPVLGLYEDFLNTIIISLSNGVSQTVRIQTERLPDQVNRCRNVFASKSTLGDDFVFMAPANKTLPAAYDYQGNIRWALTINTRFDIKRVANGNIIVGSHRLMNYPYHVTGLFEMDLLGKIYKETRLPGNCHHDYVEMENGDLLVLTQDFLRDTTEDICVLIDRESGSIKKSWDLRQILPRDEGGSISCTSHDWFHANAICYDRKTHSLLISGRHRDAVVNIDFDTACLNWILGDPEGWPADMVDRYFFKPTGDLTRFGWPYEQHSCVLCPDGDVLVFDNGLFRSKDPNHQIANQDNYSRGVRYRIDIDKMEIEQIWQYGEELGASFFSPYISNVRYLGENHYLVHSGGIAYIDGVVSDALGSQLPADDPRVEITSITVEEKNGVVISQFETRGNIYRASKRPLYHDGDNVKPGPGELTGRLGITPEARTRPFIIADKKRQPHSRHKISIDDEIDMVTFRGEFRRGASVILCLERNSSGYFYDLDDSTFLRHAPAVDHDSSTWGEFRICISKQGLQGKYHVNLIIDQYQYETGVSIFCA